MSTDPVCERLEGSVVPLLHHVVLLHEVVVMPVEGIGVSLSLYFLEPDIGTRCQTVDFSLRSPSPVEMLDVDVHENPVEPPQHFAASLFEGFRKGNVISRREHGLVLQDVVHPLNESDDVVRGGELDRLPVLGVVLPEVLVLGTSAHHGAVGVSAGPEIQDNSTTSQHSPLWETRWQYIDFR